LVSPSISHVDLWFQIYNILVEAISVQGIQFIVSQVAPPVSDVKQGYAAGKKFHRVKVSLPIDQPLKDKLRISHPSLGSFTAYFVYEKLSRVCSFCGMLGHEFASCRVQARLLRLSTDPQFLAVTKLQNLKPDRVGG
jgi:Zinc knuckle